MKNTNGGPEVKLFSKLDKIVFAALGLVVLAAVSWKILDVKPGKKDKSETTEKKKAKEEKADLKSKPVTSSTQVKIVRKWDMPAELKEISALCYMDEHRFLTVQDEVGTVFIYNTETEKVEKKIPFTGKGDFEGIALKEKTAYVLRADGRIFEVDLEKSGKRAKELKTSLTAKHDVEGFCYDKDNDRLLLAIKNVGPSVDADYKGIYAFDLKQKTFVEEPVIKIDLNDPAFEGGKKKSVMPSSITIHPASKDIYITDGPKSKLLILDRSGKVKSFIVLGKDFTQPEGITFSPGGQLYISNEGTKEPGNIIELEITAE